MASVHLGLRSYFSKYALKLFFCSYMKGDRPSYKQYLSQPEYQKHRPKQPHSLAIWTESRRETQHCIALGQGEGGKRHSHKGPTPVGIFLEGTSPTLQLNNTSPSAGCGPKRHLSLSREPVHQTTPSSQHSTQYPLTFGEYSLSFWKGTHRAEGSMKNFRQTSAWQIHSELCAARGYCNKD